jgi:hypothetical protein
VQNGDPSTVNRDAVCRGTATDMDPTLSTLSFFLAGSSDPYTQTLAGNNGEEFTYNVYWDVIGPAAPQNLSVQAADTAVELSWSSTSSSSSGGVTVPPPCLKGYQAYAVPIPYNGPLPDAGLLDTMSADSGGDTILDTFIDDTSSAADTTVDEADAPDTAPADTSPVSTDSSSTTSDAGASDSSSSGGGCGLTPLIAGYHPGPELDQYKKGPAVIASATSLRVDGLTNYQYYSLSMGGTDTFDNVGPLAAPVCSEPKDTVDFFGAYRGAGGDAGGGYCAFGRRPIEVVGGSIALLALLGLATRRARRSTQ